MFDHYSHEAACRVEGQYLLAMGPLIESSYRLVMVPERSQIALVARLQRLWRC